MWRWDKSTNTIDQESFKLTNPYDVDRLKGCNELTTKMKEIVHGQLIYNDRINPSSRGYFFSGYATMYDTNCDAFREFLSDIKSNHQVHIGCESSYPNYISTKFNTSTNKVEYKLDYY